MIYVDPREVVALQEAADAFEAVVRRSSGCSADQLDEAMVSLMQAVRRFARIAECQAAVGRIDVKAHVGNNGGSPGIEAAMGFTGDTCRRCGACRMRRVGTCLTCYACGESTGC